MRVLVTSPKWWGRHLLALLAIAACAFLGRWQWDKAMYGSGDLVNLGYGLQWWSFAAVIVYGWYRLVRETVHPRSDKSEEQPQEGPAEPRLVEEALDLTGRVRRAAPVEEDDPELAAYNAYLAQLSARARR